MILDSGRTCSRMQFMPMFISSTASSAASARPWGGAAIAFRKRTLSCPLRGRMRTKRRSTSRGAGDDGVCVFIYTFLHKEYLADERVSSDGVRRV